MKRIAEIVMGVIAMIAFGAFLAVIVVEWMAGCGETYVDAYGKRHQYECVFLTLHNEGESK